MSTLSSRRLCFLHTFAIAVAAFGVLAAPASADVVLYLIPNTQTVVSLQGTVNVNPGRTVSFRHPKFGVLVFGLEDTQIYNVPTTETVVGRKLTQATTRKNADELLEAARLALKHGLLKEFNLAIDKLLQVDPKNKAGRRVRYLQEQMAKPLGESEYEEAKLRKLVGKRDMKVKKSKHFILLYDTSDELEDGQRKTRAEERLELLEMVYESFLLKFYLNNLKLDIPQERLMVVLFAQEKDYFRFAQTLDPALKSASGFWVPAINVSVFYDQGTGESFAALRQHAANLEQLKKEAVRVKASNAKDIVRMANTIGLLVQVMQEDQDIEVVSHEATHQMAGSTGLFPRNVDIPIWVHEGLATYFESPSDATWAGIGAVNEQRLQWYRALQADRIHSNIDFISQDRIFKEAATHGSRLHGYGQAWALTHFLMEEHFDKLMVFYGSIAKTAEGEQLGPKELKKLFTDAFGKDHKALDAEWRKYMESLKTDLEQVIGDKLEPNQ